MILSFYFTKTTCLPDSDAGPGKPGAKEDDGSRGKKPRR